MTASALAHRYAGALADVAASHTAEQPPQQVVQQLRSFEAALESSSELRNVLTTPALPTQRKKVIVGRIAEKLELARITRNFLFVLLDHRRIGLFSEIIDAVERELDERLGMARAEVTSARELTPRQKEDVEAELERVAGKKVRLRFSVDDSLIGGIVARIGSTVYDGSVRGQLRVLGKRLAAEA